MTFGDTTGPGFRRSQAAKTGRRVTAGCVKEEWSLAKKRSFLTRLFGTLVEGPLMLSLTFREEG